MLYFKISWPGDLPQLMPLTRWNYYAENLEQLHFQLLSDLSAEKKYVFISIINKSIPLINLTDHDHQKLAKHQTTSQILYPRYPPSGQARFIWRKVVYVRTVSCMPIPKLPWARETFHTLESWKAFVLPPKPYWIGISKPFT